MLCYSVIAGFTLLGVAADAGYALLPWRHCPAGRGEGTEACRLRGMLAATLRRTMYNLPGEKGVCRCIARISLQAILLRQSGAGATERHR
jgi:hypothetical protein